MIGLSVPLPNFKAIHTTAKTTQETIIGLLHAVQGILVYVNHLRTPASCISSVTGVPLASTLVIETH